MVTQCWLFNVYPFLEKIKVVSLVGALRANTGMKRVFHTRSGYNTGFSYRYRTHLPALLYW